MNPRYTVAAVFRTHFQEYLQKYGPVPKHYYAVANALMECRTEKLGGHVYRCDSCDHELTLYNSCRNRHCPQCQALARSQWVNARMNDVLPVPYFHVVFTIPHQLNSIVLRNKKIVYDLLFQAVSRTLCTLAKDAKRIGGEIGFIAALHTWGQNLMDHPHIHCIVPGGAFNRKEDSFKLCKNNFLFPVAVMQKLFRGIYMEYLLKTIADTTITPLFCATADYPDFNTLVKKLYRSIWVVYVKKPFTSTANLLKYLARYTNRVAIANHRIIQFQNGTVTFSYKDYADHDTHKTMTLTAVEFIRRFMVHILPVGFMRIRQYGFLSNRAKRKLLPRIKEHIKNTGIIQTESIGENHTAPAHNQFLCPHCKTGILKKIREIVPAFTVFATAAND